MIAIIADDLTGAAELGAVGLRYGLTAEVQGSRREDSPAQLVILNTDSRPLPPATAASAAAAAAADVREARWVYKKVDSVLRGPVVAEIAAALPTLGLERALLCPANPSLGRVIRDGHYYVDGRPLHQTGFAADKDCPAATSEVLALLGGGPVPMCLLKRGESLPPHGIAVAEADCAADLAAWAALVDRRTLPVGGAEFFAAVLESLGERARPAETAVAAVVDLLVCGSSPPYARRTVEQARQHGAAVLPMPQAVLATDPLSPQAVARWAQDACAAMDRGVAAVVAIGQGDDRAGRPQMLTARLADVAAEILKDREVAHVCVEGGATAWALVRRMGWRRLTVLAELAPGVASLNAAGVEAPVLTIKPGSYAWPETIWKGGS